MILFYIDKIAIMIFRSFDIIIVRSDACMLIVIVFSGLIYLLLSIFFLHFNTKKQYPLSTSFLPISLPVSVNINVG